MTYIKKLFVTVGMLFTLALPSHAVIGVEDIIQFVDDCTAIVNNCMTEDVILVVTPVKPDGTTPVSPAVDANGNPLYTFIVAVDGGQGTTANSNPAGQGVVVVEDVSTFATVEFIITQEGNEGAGSDFVTAPPDGNDLTNMHDRIIEYNFVVDPTVANGNCAVQTANERCN